MYYANKTCKHGTVLCFYRDTEHARYVTKAFASDAKPTRVVHKMLQKNGVGPSLGSQKVFSGNMDVYEGGIREKEGRIRKEEK